ncbi:hypothetical protein bcgnr5378_06170 [Bacillus cereus]|uniref:Uncharacterized protein n=1 Tax=Bacillus cereus TaxID=1396 RepID=A0A162NW64_BACCE|nr:hypothetical protein [Bacillus cereus]KZD55613.1 hypothetical protein B4088_5358 [Bacillus cereus]
MSKLTFIDKGVQESLIIDGKEYRIDRLSTYGLLKFLAEKGFLNDLETIDFTAWEKSEEYTDWVEKNA